MHALPSFEDRIQAYFQDHTRYHAGETADLPFLLIQPPEKKRPIQVYIEHPLFQAIRHDPAVYRRHLKALQYGYVGDKKGLNGIRNVHSNDGRVFRAATASLKNGHGRSAMERYTLTPHATIPIKVVAHDTSGRRLYGIMDKQHAKVVLLDVTHY